MYESDEEVEVVIRIPKEEYDLCKKTWDTDCLDVLMSAVKYGTLLEKGHGRIIDEGKITKCEQVGLAIKDGNVRRIMATDAPTIIEKDRTNRINNKIKDDKNLEEPEEDVER